MEYKITPERQAFLEARGKTILMACPGSGKTTSIVYKLGQLIGEVSKRSNGYGGVACLSFTNVACDEYRSKFKEFHHSSLSFPHLISTIDSFVTQQIVLPFANVLGIKGILRINNEVDILKNLYAVTYEKNGKIEKGIHPALIKFAKLVHQKAPEECKLDITGCFWKNKKLTDKTEIEYAKECFKIRLEKGVITSQDALFIAYNILRKEQEIAKSLALRYPYIIIDEAQDTTALQMEIFTILRNSGVLNMEFVGDLAQSIYGWNNAKPELLENLSNGTEFNTLHFTECRRSVQHIIDFYSRLRIAGLPKINSCDVYNKNCPIIVYRYDEDDECGVIRNFNEKCDEYELYERLVLVRGKEELLRISGYQKKLDLWKSSVPYYLIEAQIYYQEGNFNQSIRRLRDVWSDCVFSKYPSMGKRTFDEAIDTIENNALLLDVVKSLPSLENTIEDWEIYASQLLKSSFQLKEIPSFERKSKMQGYEMKSLIKEKMSNYFGISNDASDYRSQVHTIHAVKGASVDAVLLFLSKTHNVNTISLEDFPNKNVFLQNMTESQRLIYVACSRAKQFLALAVPSEITEDQITEKLGNDVIIKSPNVQLELF